MEGLLFRKSGAVMLAAGLCIVPAALADDNPIRRNVQGLFSVRSPMLFDVCVQDNGAYCW